jgi:hypothetical protein
MMQDERIAIITQGLCLGNKPEIIFSSGQYPALGMICALKTVNKFFLFVTIGFDLENWYFGKDTDRLTG